MYYYLICFSLFGCFELTDDCKVLQIYFWFISHIAPISLWFCNSFLMQCIITGCVISFSNAF